MARALRVRLIAIKKEINAEKLRVEEQLAHLQANYSYDQEESQSDEAEKFQKLMIEKVSLNAQLNRAHLYGRLFAGDLIFRCIPCFVLHDAILNMRRTKARVAGVKRYKCPRCGEELNSDDQP